MKKLIAFLITTCLAATLSFAENADDVLNIIPGAKTTHSTTQTNTTSTTKIKQNSITIPKKKADRGNPKKKLSYHSHHKKIRLSKRTKSKHRDITPT